MRKAKNLYPDYVGKFPCMSGHLHLKQASVVECDARRWRERMKEQGLGYPQIPLEFDAKPKPPEPEQLDMFR